MTAQDDTAGGTDQSAAIPMIRVPAALTFAGLAAGIALGIVLGHQPLGQAALAITDPLGALWLRALQMTIVPLVIGLLVTGIVRTAAAARAGAMARRTLSLFFAVLLTGTVMSALLMPLLLGLVPIPSGAAGALSGGLAAAEPAKVPGLADFLGSLIPENIIAAAADGAMMPLIVFFSLFALALTRLGTDQRDRLAGLFAALAAAMMVIIGWVLAIAPLGVFALGFGLAARSGGAAIGALAHYIVLVTAIGAVILLSAYFVAVLAARLPLLRFARAVLPAQAVAISTQSSLASLPAMLAACRELGVRQTSADFVLPLAVALFRATSPAMNLAVAIYVASLAGVPLTPGVLIAGITIATLTTVATVSLPGTISFITSVAPIGLAMGVPLGPLALLVAVEVLPDIMRTLGNVTMNVAVTATADRGTEG